CAAEPSRELPRRPVWTILASPLTVTRGRSDPAAEQAMTRQFAWSGVGKGGIEPPTGGWLGARSSVDPVSRRLSTSMATGAAVIGVVVFGWLGVQVERLLTASAVDGSHKPVPPWSWSQVLLVLIGDYFDPVCVAWLRGPRWWGAGRSGIVASTVEASLGVWAPVVVTAASVWAAVSGWALGAQETNGLSLGSCRLRWKKDMTSPLVGRHGGQPHDGCRRFPGHVSSYA
ncbi:MAG: hypothetical protein ACRDUA_23300, partial [Micromonosporaceae bacterium]